MFSSIRFRTIVAGLLLWSSMCGAQVSQAADSALTFQSKQTNASTHTFNEWEQRARDGDAAAQIKVAESFYASGNYPEAVLWWRKAAEQGDTEAQFSLGNMLAIGRGVTKNFKEALVWLHKAAEKDPNCAFKLAIWYTGAGSFPKDEKEALKWFRLAADKDTQLAYKLATYFSRGEYVYQNDREAARWFKKAAIQGDAWAQHSLGSALQIGRGVSVDVVSAYAWLSLAAAAKEPHPDVTQARSELADQMNDEQIAEGQRLTREWKLGSDLGEVRIKNIKPKHPDRSARADENSTRGGDWPARPEKRPGVTSCNTNCFNGDCRRTYDNGRKVRFQAEHKWNPLNNQFEWSSGPC